MVWWGEGASPTRWERMPDRSSEAVAQSCCSPARPEWARRRWPEACSGNRDWSESTVSPAPKGRWPTARSSTSSAPWYRLDPSAYRKQSRSARHSPRCSLSWVRPIGWWMRRVCSPRFNPSLFSLPASGPSPWHWTTCSGPTRPLSGCCPPSRERWRGCRCCGSSSTATMRRRRDTRSGDFAPSSSATNAFSKCPFHPSAPRRPRPCWRAWSTGNRPLRWWRL
jgi:hypothetical protein